MTTATKRLTNCEPGFADSLPADGGRTRKAPLVHKAREGYHAALLNSGVLCISGPELEGRRQSQGVPSNADGNNATSVLIAKAVFDRVGLKAKIADPFVSQMAGSEFGQITRSFVEETLRALNPYQFPMRESEAAGPVAWIVAPNRRFAKLVKILENNLELSALLSNHSFIVPEFLIVHRSEPDRVCSSKGMANPDKAVIVSGRRKRTKTPALHEASMACKWTLKGDGQEVAWAEARRTFRNGTDRPSHLLVTGEPLPSRLATFALGSPDVHCVYHFALPELAASVCKWGLDDSAHLLRIMVERKRLKDIANLPLDLAEWYR